MILIYQVQHINVIKHKYHKIKLLFIHYVKIKDNIQYMQQVVYQ